MSYPFVGQLILSKSGSLEEMSTSLIVTIIVIALLLFFLFWGFHRGFLRIILTTMALVVTIVLASVLVPWFSGVLEKTSLGDTIHSKIEGYVDKSLGDPMVESVKSVQDTVIDNLPLPNFIKKDFNNNNTPEEYLTLQISTFSDYLKTRLSSLALSAAAYIILMILIFIILRILLLISKVIQKAPVIGGVNRILGAIFGLLEGLLILWSLCLILMLISGTPFGSQVMEVVEDNAFLKFIYDNNGILFAVNMISHRIL